MKNFLRLYIAKHRLQSVDVWDMKQCLEEYVETNMEDSEEILKQIDWNYWLFTPGMIGNEYIGFADNEEIRAVETLVKCYQREGKTCEKDIYPKLQLDLKIIFVKLLYSDIKELDSVKVKRIREEVNPGNITNPEVLSVWYSILVRHAHELDKDIIVQFLTKYGRLKYIRPVYLSYAASAKEVGIEIYKKIRPRYHPIAQKAIDKILGYQP